MIDDRKIRANQIVKELRAEIRDNRREEKRYAKWGQYAQAAHIRSVNECLEYVISLMTSGSTALT